MLQLPCMLVCNLLCANRTRDRGCSKHPVFPAPSILRRGPNEDANLGRVVPRDRERTLSRRHPRRRVIQYPRGSSGWTDKPRRTGSPACAGDDSRWRGAKFVYTGSAIEYFTWLSAKLDSIDAMPSSRVSLFFRNAS